MYEIAREKMNVSQGKYKTYVDKKKLDDILNVDEKICFLSSNETDETSTKLVWSL